MLIELLKQSDHFSFSEEAIAEYVLQHISSIIDLSAEQLGDKTNTSKSSVLRLCKKVGMKGYREFQNQLVYESSNADTKSFASINKESNVKDTAFSIEGMYESLSHQIRSSLDYNQINYLVKKIKSSDHVDIYGVGATFSLASDFAFKLQNIGINANALNGFNEHAIGARKENDQTISFVLSFTGRNSYICDIAKTLKRNGYYVIGIGGDQHHELKDVCSSYISLHIEITSASLEILTAHYAFTYVLDILFVSLLVENYDENVKAALNVYRGKYLYK